MSPRQRRTLEAGVPWGAPPYGLDSIVPHPLSCTLFTVGEADMKHRLVRFGVFAACVILLAPLAIDDHVRAQAGTPDVPTFSCMTGGTKVRHTYITHANPDKLKEAV